jgi:hypothetical protein
VTESKVATPLGSTLREMKEAMEYCVRLTRKRDQPLFGQEESGLPVDLANEVDSLPDSPLATAEPGYVDRICTELHVTDPKEIEVLGKAWKRVVGCLTARRKGGANADEDEDGVQGGRSVRTL